MTTLTDRYVSAAVGSLPARQRADVELELRASIEDAVEDRAAVGTDPRIAERDVLEDLGDPAVLAATYADQPLHLIGPTNFLTWRRLVIVLLAVVVPLVAIVTVLAGRASDRSTGDIIGAAIWASIDTAVHIAFWTTLAFAILDRTGVSRKGPLQPWTVDMVPDLPGRRVRFGETIFSIGFLVVFGGFLVWQQWFSVFRNDLGERVPMSNPDLWSFWLPFLLVVMLAEIVLLCVLYRNRGTRSLASVNVLLNAAWALPIAILSARGDLLNPEVFATLGWSEGAERGSIVSIVIILTAVGVGIWDSVDGFVRAGRVERTFSILVAV